MRIVGALFFCKFLLIFFVACSPNSSLFLRNYEPNFPEPLPLHLQSPEVQKERKDLARWLSSGPATNFYPTGAMAVLVNAKPVFVHYVRSSPKHAYGLASLTKIFTGLAIMQLYDAGKLDLEDPVERFLPRLHIRRAGLKSDVVRIRHLLSHTSGLPDKRYYKKQEWLKTTGLPFRVPLPIYPAGMHYRYSNQGFMILGKIVEAASGMPMRKYYKKNIFDPLGMRGAYFRARHSGAFGLNLTLPDLMQFAAFWMRGGVAENGKRLLKRTSFHKMMQPPYYYPGGPNNEYCGLAWRVYRDAKGVQQIFHIGGANGVMAWLQIFPRLNASVMYLANPPRMEDKVMNRIPYLQYRLGKFAAMLVGAKRLPSDYKVTLAPASRNPLLVGEYQSPISQRRILVRQSSSEPHASAQLALGKKPPEKLVPASLRHYYGKRSGTKYDFVYVPDKKRPIAIATFRDYYVRKN